MNIHHNKFLFLTAFLFSFFISFESKATAIIEHGPDGVYIQNITTSELQEIFKTYKYKDYIYMPEWIYPPIFLQSLPLDYWDLKDANYRNRLFIQILAPLVLNINDEIEVERYEISTLKEKWEKDYELTPQEEKFLEEKAQKYDIFTRMKGTRRYAIYFKELMLKVDRVPSSLLIGIAAIESNWGTSRPVKEGNALYKELNWYSTDGLKPEGEYEDPNYRIKTFPSLSDSIQSYALKLNSNINFENMRFLRSQYRWREQPVLGRTMAHTMIYASPLKNYAGLLDYTITFYELNNFDEASLGDDIIPQTP